MPIKNCDSCQNAEGVIRDDQNSLVCKACFNRDEDIYLSPVCNEQIERYRCDACGLLNIQIRKWGCQELGPFCICAGSNGERARMRGGYQITERDALRRGVQVRDVPVGAFSDQFKV